MMPTWSPRGDSIAFVRSDSLSQNRYYIARSDGSGETRARRRVVFAPPPPGLLMDVDRCRSDRWSRGSRERCDGRDFAAGLDERAWLADLAS